jgi:hypothetical protein
VCACVQATYSAFAMEVVKTGFDGNMGERERERERERTEKVGWLAEQIIASMHQQNRSFTQCFVQYVKPFKYISGHIMFIFICMYDVQQMYATNQ